MALILVPQIKCPTSGNRTKNGSGMLLGTKKLFWVDPTSLPLFRKKIQAKAILLSGLMV